MLMSDLQYVIYGRCSELMVVWWKPSVWEEEQDGIRRSVGHRYMC